MKTVDGVFGICNQGWNLSSERHLLARFVEKQGLVESFQNFLEEVVAEENGYAQEDEVLNESL